MKPAWGLLAKRGAKKTSVAGKQKNPSKWLGGGLVGGRKIGTRKKGLSSRKGSAVEKLELQKPALLKEGGVSNRITLPGPSPSIGAASSTFTHVTEGGGDNSAELRKKSALRWAAGPEVEGGLEDSLLRAPNTRRPIPGGAARRSDWTFYCRNSEYRNSEIPDFSGSPIPGAGGAESDDGRVQTQTRTTLSPGSTNLGRCKSQG